MLILAKSAKGQEFFYNPTTAHQVSKASAKRIRDALNKTNYNLKAGEVWELHDVAEWDDAGIYAQNQAFELYKGAILERRL